MSNTFDTESPTTVPSEESPTQTEASARSTAGRGYAEQVSALSPMGFFVAGSDGITYPERLEKGDGTHWTRRVYNHFTEWDSDGDGHLSMDEVNTRLSDANITGHNAAALAALHKYLYTIEELSNDEWGDENDGVTRDDLLTYKGNPDAYVEANYRSNATSIALQSRELFPNGTPSLSALEQGALGDCYFLAALGSAISMDPVAITRMIREHTRGTPPKPYAYTVDFPGHSAVTIDPPTDAEIARYSSSGADGLWLPVMEKAYARVVSGQANSNRQEEIGEGSGVWTGVNTMGGTGTDTDILAVTSVEETKAKLDAAFPNGVQKKVVSAQIGPFGNDLNLPTRHVYSVIGWNGSKIKIRNPWGSNPEGAPGEADGIFELTLDKFDSVFTSICYAQ